ncbi:MAG: TSCPD domain-containing protein [Spirochaetes bacterium]|nr:MAG: TSCPD domain-containing protein [Spirochaetota bacterium]
MVIDSKVRPELSANALVVLRKRYLAKDEHGKTVEDPRGMFERIAKYIASADLAYGKTPEETNRIAARFYEMMARLEFIPNSPTLMNAGRPLGQLSACFVLPVGDSIDDIFDSIKNMALIHKSGGGTGFSFSRLRPKNDVVNSTSGVSSGPVSFMKIFNTATETIKQGGTRRGANMAILSVHHPDILDFIAAKEDPSALTNFNCSVALTDSFMRAVETDGEFDLVNPRGNVTVQRLKARDVFSLIVKKAWQNGEPGIVFIDRINEYNPLAKVGPIESTNPCVTSDTMVFTAEGPRFVRELVGRRFAAIVDGLPSLSSSEGFFSTGVKPVFRLVTRSGYEVRLTADHPVLVAASVTRSSVETKWVRAGDLKPGDRICLHNHRANPGWEGRYGFEEGYLTGLLYGDGTIKKDKAIISVWPRRQAANGETLPDAVMELARECAYTLPHRADFQGFSEVRGRGEYRMAIGALKGICADLGITPGNKTITPKLEACSSNFNRGFLRGLFDTDGSVQGTQAKGISVRLAQSDMEMLKAVQRILLRFGIVSSIYEERRPEGTTMLPDGKGGQKEYRTRAQHELVIARDNLRIFSETIGFTDQDKALRLQSLLASYGREMNRERFLTEVRELIPDGTEEVYDVQVPGINRFDAGGIMLHNCGEQPLLPYESCNLGSINLVTALERRDGKDTLDYAKLKELTREAVHFLDNVIDMNQYSLPEIREQTLASRKIGLGIMGFADMLIRLNVPYDSDGAIRLAEEVMHAIQDEARAASRALAKERGAFPLFDMSEYAARGEEKLRNATTTTIAPTGTISIIANTTSGIEPIFALAYVRNVMDNNSLVEANPLFEATARERKILTDELMKQVAESGSVAHIEGVPEDVRRVFVTAHDISPESHIRIQAAFQKYVDNAVSKTVNFPNTATEQDIEKVYRLAYALNCKGVTVYRDGSRDNQVLEVQRDKKEAVQEGTPGSHLTPKSRGEVTFGSTRKMTTGCGSLYVTINADQDGLFEVFATMGKGGGCAASQTEAVSRLISLSLRCGIEPEQIIRQIKGVRCPNQAWEKGGRIYSCADAIAKALERHLGMDSRKTGSATDEAKNFAETNGKGQGNVTIVGVCPDCHGPLEFESGCSVCRLCGFSKCG